MAALAPTIRAIEKTPLIDYEYEGGNKRTCSLVVSEFDDEKQHLDSKRTKTTDSDFEDKSSDDEFVPDPRDVERYRAEMASHGGFGKLTYFRGIGKLFFITPVINPMNREVFVSRTKAAIDQHNKDNKESHLVLEKILNFNYKFASQPTAYMTFQAMDTADNKIKTYQAMLDTFHKKFLSISEKCQS